MAELLLIVRLAGRRIACPASQVEGLVELEGIVPVPRAAPHVAGLSALRSRVLTVIDANAALGFQAEKDAVAGDAIVVPCDGHHYALRVEAVEDVVEASAPPAPMAAQAGRGWDRVALGMVDVGADLLLLVDLRRFIAGSPALAA
ncbi:MAG TPA: chemotaxis protein CheW [Allosphingosinicella sp.]|jgi:purine-binding chemotaxis protein CheW